MFYRRLITYSFNVCAISVLELSVMIVQLVKCGAAVSHVNRWAWGHTKCFLAPPNMKLTGQESGFQLLARFQLLIVSAVKIGKHCIHTASVPQTAYYQMFAPGPTMGPPWATAPIENS